MILGPLSASVFVDNQPLQEYKEAPSEAQGENIMTCWIASEAGKEFEIRGKILKPQPLGIWASAFVDGLKCPPWVSPPRWRGTVEFDCISDGTDCGRLMFKDIEFTDDDDSVLDDRSSGIGQIVLRLQKGKFIKAKSVRKAKSKPARRAKLTRNAKFTGFARSKNVDGHTLHVHEGKVHERSKKGRDHRVGLGRRLPDQEEQTTYETIWSDEPATVFIFNFTSLDNLQAMDIAPRTSNLPIPVDGDSDNISIDTRIKELELELYLLRVKQTTGSTDQRPSPIKSEQ
ncbi:uncharacterized protein HD556DRAFT_1438047 [Suillus plorans]|uniref:DUF7918 domain-containing protein n=1 Tax=Suillus plorans TaxID=116603 RepID=A0A9P7DSI5_9AGAM|nr:uncharacterized protein HD556DRAFT_1438047 [Suillus plorans]KAG1802009.1 hypothetical protein HD556DRAFT_1438047 [Suillus plorans]